jgi:hypothetical protein
MLTAYYHHLNEMLARMVEDGFLRPEYMNKLQIADDSKTLLQLIYKNALLKQKWTQSGETIETVS